MAQKERTPVTHITTAEPPAVQYIHENDINPSSRPDVTSRPGTLHQHYEGQLPPSPQYQTPDTSKPSHHPQIEYVSITDIEPSPSPTPYTRQQSPTTGNVRGPSHYAHYTPNIQYALEQRPTPRPQLHFASDIGDLKAAQQYSAEQPQQHYSDVSHYERPQYDTSTQSAVHYAPDTNDVSTPAPQVHYTASAVSTPSAQYYAQGITTPPPQQYAHDTNDVSSPSPQHYAHDTNEVSTPSPQHYAHETNDVSSPSPQHYANNEVTSPAPQHYAQEDVSTPAPQVHYVMDNNEDSMRGPESPEHYNQEDTPAQPQYQYVTETNHVTPTPPTQEEVSYLIYSNPQKLPNF